MINRIQLRKDIPNNNIWKKCKRNKIKKIKHYYK